MARGIEVDWVVVRIITIRKVIVVGLIAAIGALLLWFLHNRMNPTPDVAAKRAIRLSEAARDRARAAELPEAWAGELEHAEEQLELGRTAYTDDLFVEAKELADTSRQRFEALAGAGNRAIVGAGQFHSLHGRVTIQRSGRSGWEAGKLRMPLFNGDFVKTGRDGSAEILFADGTLFRVAPNSLLEVHHRSRATEEGGAVKMVVGRINVTTGGSKSVVETDSVETSIDRDSRVAVNVDGEKQQTVVSAFSGGATVSNPEGSRVRVATREQLVATDTGDFSDKRRLPDPPNPLSPINNAGFDLSTDRLIQLRWSLVRGTNGSRLQVSRSKNFAGSELDVDSPILPGNTASLEPLLPGTYFWRVSSVVGEELASEWSSVRRFRIYSPKHRRIIRDLVPPELVISPVRQLGHMVIIEGKTEPGATVTINGDPVETGQAGRFRRTVEVRNVGWNEIIIRSTDPSGNQRERRERVFLEEF